MVGSRWKSPNYPQTFFRSIFLDGHQQVLRPEKNQVSYNSLLISFDTSLKQLSNFDTVEPRWNRFEYLVLPGSLPVPGPVQGRTLRQYFVDRLPNSL